MAAVADDLIEGLLYETPQGRRFLQDSPVMPDIWLAFARASREHQEVLITPHRDVRTADMAKRLRHAIALSRDAFRGRIADPYEFSELRLAPLSSQVAVRLSFPELMGSVIPLTNWWWSIMRGARRRKFQSERPALRDQLIAALIENEDRVGLPPGLVWLARLAGIIHLSAQHDVADLEATLLRQSTYRESVGRNGLQEAVTAVSDAFFDLMPEFSFDIPEEMLSDTPGPHKRVCIHRVARNRRHAKSQ